MHQNKLVSVKSYCCRGGTFLKMPLNLGEKSPLKLSQTLARPVLRGDEGREGKRACAPFAEIRTSV